MPKGSHAAAALLALCAACGRSDGSATRAPAVDEHPEHNFRFRPPASWTRQDAARIDPGATLAYTRAKPELSFLVYPSRPGTDVALEAVVASWRKQLESQASGAVELSSSPLELNGLSGMRAEAMATVRGEQAVYVSWNVARNGWLYQLLAWGAVKDRAALEADSRALFGGFELIDPGARAVPVRRPAKRYASRDSGWSIDLGVPWMAWPGFKDGLPAAEFGASCGDASVVVASVPLLGHRPPLDVAVPALLTLLEVRDAQDLPRRPLRVGSWTGSELPYQQKIYGRWMKVRLWALVGEEAALVAAERRPPEQPESECAEPLDKLAVGAARTPRADAVQDKEAAARFFVEVGRRLRASRRVAESAAYFAEAGALAPGDPGHLLDEVRLLQQAGQTKEAVRRIAARLHGAPCASALRVRAAQLLAELGRAPEAIATWSSAFECGYRDPDALSDYLRFLEREGRLTLAFHEAQRFADPADLPRLRGQLAAGDRQ
jgi:hypothetical protein